MPEACHVPGDDRGLAFGDGLFETVLMRAGQPLLWSSHVKRLARGCQRLDLPMPSLDALEASFTLDPARGLEVFKLVVTRGSGGQGYQTPEVSEPRLLVSYRPFTAPVERWRHGACVRLCELRLGHQPRLSGIKHLSRLENVLARQEWRDPDIHEGLLLDTQGLLIEAVSMNVFWRDRGRVFTPMLEQCGVAGTLRDALIEQGHVEVAEIDARALLGVEALWVGNSVQGLWPIHTLLDAGGAALAHWPLTPGSLQREAHRLLGYPDSF
ncbi:aminodeoxychorismate lyase [Halomonas sp. PAMB 3264]|uniref:aminodeoxychorismate lyase n=1 Tax=Halomonas sp. PAMB 3264 TaxID=3075222 RepID=UPI00289D351E|nr:aminodeoxychorismate lyase [Halomonas sp. PAMB 3264]WNL43729.1 aminodeoxychorismate lyase [Halomonas sp. PAMB 3264]